MEAQKVDMFIMANGKFFESHQVALIRDRLLEVDDSKWGVIQTLQFKNPTTHVNSFIACGKFRN